MSLTPPLPTCAAVGATAPNCACICAAVRTQQLRVKGALMLASTVMEVLLMRTTWGGEGGDEGDLRWGGRPGAAGRQG